MPLLEMSKCFIPSTMAVKSKPLNTRQILWEAIKLPTRNWGLVRPILLLSLLSSSLLYLLNYLSLYPLLLNLVVNLSAAPAIAPGSPDLAGLLVAAGRDVTQLMIIEIVFIIVSFFVFSLLSTATVTASASICTVNRLTLKEVLSSVRTSWKGPTSTKFFVDALFSGYVLLLTPLPALVVIASYGSAYFGALVLALSIALALAYLYVRFKAVWGLAFVVSVVEEGCRGAGAIARAEELIKGRRRQGMFIAFLVMAVTAAIYGVFAYFNGYVLGGVVGALAGGVVAVNAFTMWGMVAAAAYTVFYYDCRPRHGEEMVPLTEKNGYTKTAAMEVDVDLP